MKLSGALDNCIYLESIVIWSESTKRSLWASAPRTRQQRLQIIPVTTRTRGTRSARGSGATGDRGGDRDLLVSRMQRVHRASS